MDFLVIGLGNPGREYAATRHNVGWRVLDTLASNWKMETKFRAETAPLTLGGKKILLMKPQTFMNLSGESVRAVSDFYKVSPTQTLVISDDVDLPFGALRIRPSGGSGGHNGLKSIMQHLGTEEFPRLKIGVRNPLLDETPIETADFGRKRGQVPFLGRPWGRMVDPRLNFLIILVIQVSEPNGFPLMTDSLIYPSSCLDCGVLTNVR